MPRPPARGHPVDTQERIELVQRFPALAIGARTAGYYAGCGLRPVRRRPS